MYIMFARRVLIILLLTAFFPVVNADAQLRRVIIDADPGQDDAVAILMAMRSPNLRIEAITAVMGNVPLDVTLEMP